MAVDADPIVLLVTADERLARDYVARLESEFRIEHRPTIEGAVEALDPSIGAVLLVKQGLDRQLEDALATFPDPDSAPAIGVLTDRSLEELPSTIAAAIPPSASESELQTLVAKLLGVKGLERAIRSFGRLATKRARVAQRMDKDEPSEDPEYGSLSRELRQRREQIDRYLNRLADPAFGGRLRRNTNSAPDQNSIEADSPPPVPDEPQGPLEKLRTAETGRWAWVRVGIIPFLLVLLLFGLLFAVSGTWPAIVGVGSDSMVPHLAPGDVVVLTAPGRFAPAIADTELGLVTAETARANGYQSLGGHGSVIVFKPPSRDGQPMIHRVQFRVSEGENWVDRADPAYLAGTSCEAIQNCPAPHDGFITKGDNNDRYDQSSGLAPPVREDWIMGVAKIRIPLGQLGEVFQWIAGVGAVALGQASLDFR